MKDENYLTAGYTVRSWLLTTDHKRIAILYLWAITAFFFIGGMAALAMRLQLLTPTGRLVGTETYNKLFTMHGVTMVFFFLIPSIPAVIGNFVVPLMVGARNMAFPRLNLASWYAFILGGMFVLASIIMGGVDTGWTFYTPFSSMYSNTHVSVMAVGIIIAGLSAVLLGINIIATIHQCRAPGMSWMRMPLFLWAMYASSVIFILGTPVLATSLILMIVERLYHIGIYDPALGGNPLLFQRLFWFYSLPAIYIMVLPAMGVVSEIIPCFSRKRISGYRALVGSSVMIAVLGVLIWGHHLFISEQSIYGSLVFSLFSLLVAIPLVVNVFHWTATLYQGRIYLRTPMLYALGSIGLITIGGLAGLYLATLGVSAHLEDTYFFIAHFHYIMVGGAAMGYLGAIHYWWPKITGRLYPEFWGKVAAAIIFIGFNLTFFPQFILGYLGMPRRFYHYPPEFQVLNVFSTAFASIMGVGYVLPLVYLIWSLKYGKASGPNPWSATGLEWKTPSPPPTENFADIPIVAEEAYAYENIAGHPVA